VVRIGKFTGTKAVKKENKPYADPGFF